MCRPFVHQRLSLANHPGVSLFPGKNYNWFLETKKREGDEGLRARVWGLRIPQVNKQCFGIVFETHTPSYSQLFCNQTLTISNFGESFLVVVSGSSGNVGGGRCVFLSPCLLLQ